MKVVKNTLKLEIDSWDDPGDYPSNAGGGPLPSYSFVSGVEGEIAVQLESGEIEAMVTCKVSPETLQAWLDDFPEVVDHGIPELTVKRWEVVSVSEDLVRLRVPEDEDAYCAHLPELDYDDYELDDYDSDYFDLDRDLPESIEPVDQGD